MTNTYCSFVNVKNTRLLSFQHCTNTVQRKASCLVDKVRLVVLLGLQILLHTVSGDEFTINGNNVNMIVATCTCNIQHGTSFVCYFSLHNVTKCNIVQKL